MNILALETATDNCSVAVAAGNDWRMENSCEPRAQSQVLLPTIDRLLADTGLSKSQLDGVAFGCGPGSFTGLRVAAAATQGIALALDVPVVGVSTLAAVAHQQFRTRNIHLCIAALDARMSEVYWGVYQTLQAGSTQLIAEEAVAAPDTVLWPDVIDDNNSSDVALAGSGSDMLLHLTGSDQRSVVVDAGVLPEALDTLALALPVFERGEAQPAEEARPVYLRNKVALTEQERAAKRDAGTVKP